MSRRSYERHLERELRRERLRELDRLRRQELIEHPDNSLDPIDEADAQRPALARWTESLRRRYESQSVSIKVHGFVFLVCSAGIIYLNAISPPHPWAFYPIAGWLVGFAAHARAFLSRRLELGQAEALPPGASDEAVGTLRRYQLSRGAWKQHLGAFITANAYLWGINLITSMVFPWAAIVTGAWGIGLVSHWIAASAKAERLRRRLRELGIEVDALRGSFGRPAGEAAFHPLTDKARALAEGMAAKYEASKELRGHWAEIEPLLRTAVAQIEELESKRIEFDRLTATIQDSGLEGDLAELRRKRDLAATALLKKEYDRSIAQYESHLKASSELEQHREILDLRLSSAMNLIKQLEIDSVRLASVESYEEPASLSLLRSKTDENQAFLEDFRAGLEKLEKRE